MPSMQRYLRRLKHGKPIVVVSGLPRSGTSMAMKMLEAGGISTVVDGIRTADEDNPKGYFEDERVKDLGQMDDKSWLRDSRGKAIKIIAYLLSHLPETNNYKVVFMDRKIDEVLASQKKMLERRGETSDTDDDRMIELYQQNLEKVKFTLRFRDCFDVLYLTYHEVVQDPQTHAQQLRDFVGLPLDVEKMTGVVDANLYRNRAVRSS